MKRQPRKKNSRLTVSERHQLKIARDTLRMSPAMRGVMGGMTKAEAREVFKRLMAKARGSKNPPYKPRTVMKRFRRHTLRSSSGRKVRTKGMAKAILLSELRAQGRIPPRQQNRRRKNRRRKRNQDEKFVHQAMREIAPGKKFEDLSSHERSIVLTRAQQLKMETLAGLRKNSKRKRGSWHKSMGKIGSAKSAQDWLKAMGSLRGPKKPKKNTKRPKRKRNYENAEELYAKFHGRKAGRVSDTGLPIADYGSHAELGQLGKLVSLTIGDKEAEKPWCKQISWRGSEAPDLAAEPGGRQLYLVGGNQNLNGALESLPISTDKDMIDLGFAYQIEYFTRKAFDNHQPVTYYHDLGEESGESPRAVYDRVKKRIHLVGGAYVVKPEGIVD